MSGLPNRELLQLTVLRGLRMRANGSTHGAVGSMEVLASGHWYWFGCCHRSKAPLGLTASQAAAGESDQPDQTRQDHDQKQPIQELGQ
jgi:hypothetical protein